MSPGRQTQVRSSVRKQQAQVVRERRQQKLDLVQTVRQLRAAGLKVIIVLHRFGPSCSFRSFNVIGSATGPAIIATDSVIGPFLYEESQIFIASEQLHRSIEPLACLGFTRPAT